MENIFFTRDHYYIILENDLATIGLTDFILNKIEDDISSVELPEINNLYNKNDRVGSLFFGNEELEFYTPLSGEVAEVNDNLINEPDTIKHSTYKDNWLFKIYINNPEEQSELISEDEYTDSLDNL